MKPEYLSIDHKWWHLIKFQLLVHSRISHAFSNRESRVSFTLGGRLWENYFPALPSFGGVAASRPAHWSSTWSAGLPGHIAWHRPTTGKNCWTRNFQTRHLLILLIGGHNALVDFVIRGKILRDKWVPVTTEWTFRKWDVGLWTGSSWVGIGQGGGHLRLR